MGVASTLRCLGAIVTMVGEGAGALKLPFQNQGTLSVKGLADECNETLLYMLFSSIGQCTNVRCD